MTQQKFSFFDFAPQSLDDWKKQLKSELKDAADAYSFQIEKQGIAVAPYYNHEFEIKNEATESYAQFPKIKTELLIKDSASGNEDLLKILSWGVEAVSLHVHPNLQNIDFEQLFENVYLEAISVDFFLFPKQQKWIDEFIIYLEKRSFHLSDVTGSFIFLNDEGQILSWQNQFQLFNKYHHLLPHFHWLSFELESSENTVNDLSKLFENIHSFFATLAQDSFEKTASSIQIFSSASDLFFYEIGKLKALQQLWQLLLKSYHCNTFPLHVHLERLKKQENNHQPYENILRQSTEAMIAILGGCNTLCLQTDDKTANLDEDFFHRIAINIHHVLKHEARMDKVNDPLKGAYLIEDIVEKLTQTTWQKIVQ